VELKEFLELPNGIPSHDTFGRFYAALDPEEFSRCFTRWVQAIGEVTDGEVVAVDGKTLRRSFDRASSKAAIHMVSAWASKTGRGRLPAIPRLLEILRLEGCIVTIDAIGAQKEIVKAIIDKGAHDVISLKKNQPTLHEKTEDFFKEALAERFETVPHEYTEYVENDHGRLEKRRYWVTSKMTGFESAASGRASPAWEWWSRRVKSAARPRGRCGTSSAACRGTTPRSLRGRCAVTGRWRTTCTGCWTWPSTKTEAE